MALTWTIDSVDKSSTIRLEPAWALTECAMRGQVGASSFVIDDTVGTYTPPAQKSITVVESTASPTRMFTGYVAERSVAQGSMPPGQRQWTVTVEDLNVMMDDRIITGSEGDRDGETDVARILWLVSHVSMTGVTVGHVPNTNTVTMDAADFRGKSPRDVLEDAAQKSGKNYFIYHHSSGPLLFYDRDTGTNLSSGLQVSDVAADIDNANVFGPKDVSRALDPARVYSKVRLRYKRGSASVSNATTATNYRTREKYKRYMWIKTSARATEQADKWLDQAAQEKETLSLTIEVGAAYVNDIRAGQRVEVKLTRYGIASYTWYRVTQRTVRALSDVRYEIQLQFADSVRPTRFGTGPDDVDDEMSNATEDDATVIIDSGGITVSGGSISVVNDDGVVIIDGSSQMFNIIANVLIGVPKNRQRGTMQSTLWVKTGLTTDPMTVWSMKRPGAGDGDWSQVLPLTVFNISGQMLEHYNGRARTQAKAQGQGTEIQALKSTSKSTLAGRSFRCRILRQSAI